MSLCKLALRQLAVRALLGRTLVGDKVLDSEIGSISVDKNGEIVVASDHRFIAIYTDEVEVQPSGSRTFFENGEVTLRFEFGITDRMIVEEDDPDNPGNLMKSVVSGIPYTDSSSEVYLNLVERQIRAALSASDNVAADILRSLLTRVTKIEGRRVASDDKGQRLAAWQITLTGPLIDDPVTAEDIPTGGPFDRFLTLLDAGTGDDQRLAGLIRSSLMVAGEDWQDAQTRLGLAAQELAALGLGPLVEGAETTTLGTAELAVTGHGTEVVE